MKTLHRTIHPETRIIDAAKGLVEYIASDETVDSYKEVIRADGWRFDMFKKNAPFVDSHDYGTVANQLGKVISFEVVRKKLVETVQWAIDVQENTLAKLGWKMTEAGYLKAVSVGFWPVKMLSKWDNNPSGWMQQIEELGLTSDREDPNTPRVIYTEQQQIELSACLIGANPNAVARAFKANVLDEAELEKLSTEYVLRNSRPPAIDDAHAGRPRAHRRDSAFLSGITQRTDAIKKLIRKL